MQVGGAVQGVGTIHPRRRRRLNALVAIAAIVVIAALTALMTRGMVVPMDTGGVGAQDANKAGVVGSAIVHDDAGNMPATGAGSAVVHDDAGNVR